MRGTQEQPVPAGWIGGESQLADAGRWRALGAEASTTLPTMKQAVVRLRPELAALGVGNCMRVISALAEGDHAVARLAQADLEAALVLEAAAGRPAPDEVLALFPPGHGVRATAVDGGWLLDGTQHRSIHPGAVDRALVLARTVDGDRLFSFRMDADGVVRDPTPLRTIAPQDPNGPVTFTATPAEPVGTVSWWAERAVSFEHLLRDTACWFGASVWLCRAVEATLAARPEALDLVRVGRVDVWVYSARLALRAAAAEVERDPTGPTSELAARRAAAVAATTADTVIRLVAGLSDARVTRQDVQLPARLAQLQIAMRRFDAAENLRELATLLARGRPDPV